MAHIGTLE